MRDAVTPPGVFPCPDWPSITPPEECTELMAESSTFRSVIMVPGTATHRPHSRLFRIVLSTFEFPERD